MILDELELVSANSDHSSSLNWSEYEEEPCLQGDITEATEDSRGEYDVIGVVIGAA